MKKGISRSSAIAQWGPRQLYTGFLIGIVALCLIHVIDVLAGQPFWPVTQLVFLGFERNVPTWYTSVLLLSAGAMALRCYQVGVRQKRAPVFGWLLVAVLLVVLSCDETAGIHEKLGGALANEFAPGLAKRAVNTTWTIVLGPLAVLATIALSVVMYKHLYGAKYAGLLILAGAVVLLGSAVGLEATLNWMNWDNDRALWHVEIVCEEGGEMLGAWLIGYGLTIHGDAVCSGSLGTTEANEHETDL